MRFRAELPYRSPARGRDDRASCTHADHPVRRHRLRHAAVRAGVRAGRHARADELRQSRARRVRHGGRLHHGRPGQPARRAVPRLPAARLPRSPRCSASCSSARSTSTSTRKTHLDQVLFTIGLVFMSVAAVDYVDGLAAAVRPDPVLAAGPDQPVRRRHRPLPPAHHRDLRRCSRVALQFVADAARASAAACAPRSTTRASRAASASTSTRVFAVTFAVGSGLAASAARSAPRSSASIRTSRSSS